MFIIGTAPAQTTGGLLSVPAEKLMVGPGGVDIRTGRYNYGETDVSIGDAEGGLSFKRTLPTNVPQLTNLPFGNFSNNWNITLQIIPINLFTRAQSGGYPPGDDYMAFVNFGAGTTTFTATASSTAYALESRGVYEYLNFTGTQGTPGVVYTFTANDGTIVTFRPLGVVDGLSVSGIYATQIVRPDGLTFTLDYTSYVGGTGNLARLRSVTSSRGYALLMEGSGALITKVCALNLTSAILPSNHACPSNAPGTATYTYSGVNLASVTDAGGATSQFIYGTSGSYASMAFVKPGQSSPWLTNLTMPLPDGTGGNYDAVMSQSFADGQSYTYTYRLPPPLSNTTTVAGGQYTNALGATVTVGFGFPLMPRPTGNQCPHLPCPPRTIDNSGLLYQQTSGPTAITDSLSRTTKMNYCDPGVTTGCIVSELQYVIDPAGIKTVPTYDDWHNVIQVRQIAITGSGLPDIVTSATYDCTYRKNCAKPVTKTDANGNVTTYSYDATHGGILTETAPADVNGVQRVKRYAYVQRYA
ncbi:hypothetical protein [Sphingomonas sp. RT2P30]|uniref:hypothetical protein n=1 Tax=Parasphingomonas halimpatiens TaxID=3096162 RepID=UPI002FC9573A